MVDLLKEQRECFKQEFNYAHEAENLRLMCDKVRGAFQKLEFPEPYDTMHPMHPDVSIPLVTKRVLTMDRMEGRTVTKFGQAMLNEAAAAKGMTVEDFKIDLTEQMKDPAFVEKMLSRVPSEVRAFKSRSDEQS